MKAIETERLILRAWTPEDAPDLFAYAQSPLVGPAAGWKPHETIDETREYLQFAIEQDETWAIVWKETGHAIGSVGLHKTNVKTTRELGYVLHPDYWERGIMAEAAKAVIDFGFSELDLCAICVFHHVMNRRSRRVIQKCGFRYDGSLRRFANNYNGTPKDVCAYSMTREEWEKGTEADRFCSFVQNRACEYFPCHKTNDPEHFNCLFCYCPLYRMEDCGGNPTYLANGIKDCSSCTVPHFRYDHILKKLTEKPQV